LTAIVGHFVSRQAAEVLAQGWDFEPLKVPKNKGIRLKLINKLFVKNVQKKMTPRHRLSPIFGFGIIYVT